MLTDNELISIVRTLDKDCEQPNIADDIEEELMRISFKIEDILINRGVEVNSICDS